jgi:hypothetical protein
MYYKQLVPAMTTRCNVVEFLWGPSQGTTWLLPKEHLVNLLDHPGSPMKDSNFKVIL